jgi:hypothetical protein
VYVLGIDENVQVLTPVDVVVAMLSNALGEAGATLLDAADAADATP